MHVIKMDTVDKLLQLTLSGFFTADDAAVLMRDLNGAIADMRVHGTYGALVDLRDCALQSQDMVGTFREFMLTPPHYATRVAFLTGKSVSRMQARRLLIDERVRMFDHAHDALQWVASAAHA